MILKGQATFGEIKMTPQPHPQKACLDNKKQGVDTSRLGNPERTMRFCFHYAFTQEPLPFSAPQGDS